MYHRILVALDDQACSEQVFNRAVSLAHMTQARLMLLHVLVAGEDLNVYRLESDQCQSRQDSLDVLRSHLDTVMATGAIADLRLPSGNPGQQICETAQCWGADLILMGHQQGSTEVSVSFYVLDHAPCPVLIMPDARTLTPVRDNQLAAVS